jgi:creatinine amidohydrolase
VGECDGDADVFTANNSTTELSEAGTDTAIVSVGATEQCGPHLPLHLDTLVAEYYARAWGKVLGAYVALKHLREAHLLQGHRLSQPCR